jgi:hypothetical protein
MTRPDTSTGSARHAIPLLLDEQDYLPWLNDGHTAHRLARGEAKLGGDQEQATEGGVAEFFGQVDPGLRF